MILFPKPPVLEVSEVKVEFMLHSQDTGTNVRELLEPSAARGDKFVCGIQCPALCATRCHSGVVLI